MICTYPTINSNKFNQKLEIKIIFKFHLIIYCDFNVIVFSKRFPAIIFKNWMLILVPLCENERQRWDASRCIKARVHFHITGPKLTFKTYNYRHCDTSMSLKTADYFPSGGVIATLLGNCKVLCYANMNVTLFRVSANQISVFSITQQASSIWTYEQER